MRQSFKKNMRVSRELGMHLVPSSDREKMARKNIIFSVVLPGPREAPGTSMDASGVSRPLSTEVESIGLGRTTVLVPSAPTRDSRIGCFGEEGEPQCYSAGLCVEHETFLCRGRNSSSHPVSHLLSLFF